MKNFYGIYKNSRNAAWEALLHFGVKELPVSMSNVSRQANIPIHKNSGIGLLSENEVCALILDCKENEKAVEILNAIEIDV